MELIETIQKTNIEMSLDLPPQRDLFDDDDHEIREAVAQIEKATHCGNARAYAIAMEAEKMGRSYRYYRLAGALRACRCGSGGNKFGYKD